MCSHICSRLRAKGIRISFALKFVFFFQAQILILFTYRDISISYVDKNLGWGMDECVKIPSQCSLFTQKKIFASETSNEAKDQIGCFFSLLLY